MANATVADAATSTKPVHTIRLRGTSASIFENKANTEDREFSFHKVSVSRSYKAGEEWKSTTSFGRDDLPIMALVLERAYAWILDAEAKRRGKDADAPAESML